MGGNAREEDVKDEGKRRRNKRKEKTSWSVRVSVDCVKIREYGGKV